MTIPRVGQTYGKSKVLKQCVDENGNNIEKWIMLCECGSSFIASTRIVNMNKSTCGCHAGKKSRKGFGDIPAKMWTSILQHAKSRNMNISITIEDAWRQFLKQNKRCALTNWPIYFSYGTKKATASLDRIDSSQGYNINNIQWLHKDVNLCKWDLSQSKLLDIVESIYKNKIEHDKQKTILIFGGAGYIGSRLSTLLLKNNINIIIADIFKRGIPDTLKSIAKESHRVKIIKCDITNINDVIKMFDYDINGIVLLSGIVGAPECQKCPKLAEDVNIHGWNNILKNKPNIPCIVASTGSVYGVVKNGICTEDTIPNPISEYGLSKLSGENIAISNNAIALRFATACGLSLNFRKDLLPHQLIHDALSKKKIILYEPNNLRTFIDTEDFVSSIYFCLNNFNNLKYKIYNIGNQSNNITKLELARLIQEKTGCELEINEFDKDMDNRDYYVDYSRINNEGWYAKNSINNTIQKLIDSYDIFYNELITS